MQVRQHADHTELLIRAPVRLGEVPELLEHARQALATGQSVTVDLSEAGHLHTAAWQVLLALERSLLKQSRKFEISHVSDSARTMLTYLELVTGQQAGEAGL